MNIRMKMKLTTMLSTATIMIIPAGAAMAQNSGLDEIIVTAQKKEENLQETPISITAFTAKDIQNKAITDIAQIAEFTPNLTFDTTAVISGSSSAAVVYLRGVGQSNFQVTNDPGVGTYVDGVYVSTSIGGVMDVIDIERIEVLRGPQGTLFGRNTIGGAINITTQKPSAENKGSLEMTIGNYSRIGIRASLDIPLSENLLSKWTVGYKKADGFIKLIAPEAASTVSNGNFADINRNGRDLGDENEGAARVSFLYTPSDNLEISVAADYSRVRESSAAASLVGIVNEGSFVGLYNGVDAPVIDVPGLGTGVLYDERFISDRPYEESYQTGPNGTILDGFGISGTITYDLTENITAKSITSYREVSGQFNRDADASPLQFTHTFNDYAHEQFSQELQLNGSFRDGSLEWITGVYYFDEHATDDLTAPLLPALGTVLINAVVDNQSIAGFGQATYHINDKLSAIAGIRYTKDDKALFPDFIFDPNAGGAAAGARTVPLELVEAEFSKWTPRFSLNYQWNDNFLTYLSYSEGFKSGGFNARTTAVRDSVLGFGPETLTTYEFGAKWEGFDNRVRLNMAAFWSDYEDIQVTVIDDIAPGTQNGGTAEIKGVEVELTTVLTDNLKINASLGYIDAKYTSLLGLSPDVPFQSAIGLDNALVNTPEWSTSVAFDYTIPVSNTADIVLRGDWNYTSGIQNDDINSPVLFQEGVHLFNGQIVYDMGDYQFILWGKNLSNEHIIVGGDSNPAIGFQQANFAPPRSYGLTVRHQF